MAEKTKKIQPHKIAAVGALKEKIQGCRDVVFTDFRGLKMPQFNELRRQLRAQSAEYRVVKNNFLRIAFAELGFPAADELLVDPTAVAFVKQDANTVSKALFAFTREAPLKVKGGMIGGKVFDARMIEELSRLPGREILLAMLMGTMNAPLSQVRGHHERAQRPAGAHAAGGGRPEGQGGLIDGI